MLTVARSHCWRAFSWPLASRSGMTVASWQLHALVRFDWSSQLCHKTAIALHFITIDVSKTGSGVQAFESPIVMIMKLLDPHSAQSKRATCMLF